MHNLLSLRQAPSSLERRDFSFEVKASSNGIVEGYGSVFNVRDSYDDVIVKGAFMATIADHKANNTMPSLLWQHRQEEPIGVWTDFAEDDKGLYLKGQLATDVRKGQEAYSLLKMGAISGMSIGFVSKEWSYEKDSDIRTLTQIDLWEVSLVTFPANSKARITNVKSIEDVFAPKDAEKILRDAGFSKSDATAFVSRVMRLGDSRSDSVDSTTELKAALARLHALLK